jgi:hypothetical protein
MNTKPYLTLADAKQIGAAADLVAHRTEQGQHGRARAPRIEGV